jgi:hypothetical protein
MCPPARSLLCPQHRLAVTVLPGRRTPARGEESGYGAGPCGQLTGCSAARAARPMPSPGGGRAPSPPRCGTIVRMRDERRIDDTALRQVQAALHIEEVRQSRREVAD